MKMTFTPVNYIFGAPGSGKTTILAKLAVQFIKKGVRVYSNTPISGTILYKDSDLGLYDMSNSVILFDESGVGLNSRQFKKGLMSDVDRIDYWKKIRHRNSIIIMASQSWSDTDKICRDLSQSYFLIRKGFFGFTIITPIFKRVDIDKLTHQPTDFFVMGALFQKSLCFRPRYYKYFDSYECKELPQYPDDENRVP